MIPYIPDCPILKNDIFIVNDEIEVKDSGNKPDLILMHEKLFIPAHSCDEAVVVSIEDNVRVSESYKIETVDSLHFKLFKQYEEVEEINLADFYWSAAECDWGSKCPSDEEIIKSFDIDDVEFI